LHCGGNGCEKIIFDAVDCTMKSCPRCNYEVQEGQTECPNCGVVFAQWNAIHSALSASVLPLVRARHQKYLGFFLVIFGLSMFIFGLESPTFVVAGIGWLLSGIGLALYAKGSGRSLAWGLLALWTIFGPLIGLLAFVRNKKQETNVGGNNKSPGCLAKGLTILFLFVMGFMLAAYLVMPSIEDMKNAAAPVIAALDKYRSVKGTYPDSLDKLVPEYISEVPSCRPGTPKPPIYYGLDKASGEYTLICPRFAYMRQIYRSKTRQWGTYD